MAALAVTLTELLLTPLKLFEFIEEVVIVLNLQEILKCICI